MFVTNSNVLNDRTTTVSKIITVKKKQLSVLKS